MSDVAIVELRGKIGFLEFLRLDDWGFRKEDGKWVKVCTEQEAKRYVRYAKFHGLRIKVRDINQMRSATYRQDFFRNIQPVKGKYRCVYCGRMFPKEKITVDHLYPVDKVSTDPKLVEMLRRKGIDNVNSMENLVPACRRCNRKKGTGMGIWILKGRLGRIEWLWKWRKLCRFLLFTGCILAAILFCRWAEREYGFVEVLGTFLENPGNEIVNNMQGSLSWLP